MNRYEMADEGGNSPMPWHIYLGSIIYLAAIAVLALAVCAAFLPFILASNLSIILKRLYRRIQRKAVAWMDRMTRWDEVSPVRR